MEIFVLIFGILAGGFCIAAAIFDWNFFFNARKAAPIVKIFGRNGARIFYGIMGLLFIVGGIWLAASGTLSKTV